MARTRRRSAIRLVALVGSLVLAACGPRQGAAPGGQGTPAQTAARPASGGELVLRLAKDPDNFNPILSATTYGSQVYSLVYDTLFDYDDRWNPIPRLAESWSFSPDNKVMTIKLKQGVKFHDGTLFTADDVVFTYQSMMDREYTGPRDANVKYIKAIKAVDPNTVQVDLTEPNAAIIDNLNLGILERKLFAGTPVKDFDKNTVTMKPVGTGPYKFVEYVKGQYVTLERNDAWYMSNQLSGAPFIKTVRLRIIPDDAQAEAALENGDIDVLTPDPKDLARLQAGFANKLSLFPWNRNGFGYITFNLTRPPLNDKLVRQALTYGLNRQAIIDQVLNGKGVIPPGPIPPVSWAYDPSVTAYPHDPAKARQLLEQAGYQWNAGISQYVNKKGQSIYLVLYASTGSSLSDGITAIAKQNWRDIGVIVDVKITDFNSMMTAYVKPGKFDMYFSGFTLNLDPDQTALFHSSQWSGFNRGYYSNQQVDKLLEQGVHELDQARRKTIYSEYQKIIADDAPVIFLYANTYTDAVSKKVKGGVRNMPGVGVTDVFRWWINEQ